MATEARDDAQRRLRLTYMVEVKLRGALARAMDQGADQEEMAAQVKRLEEFLQTAGEARAEFQSAADAEQSALEEFAAASQELQELTVEPRTEAAKLRFEEHKLRATLSSASIVGIAATSGLILPERPAYVAVLGAAFVCLFLSTILSLRAMKETSAYVEGTLISGDAEHPSGPLAWLTRHTFTIGLIAFAVFAFLNLLPWPLFTNLL